MKLILSFLLIFSIHACFGQMTINEIIKVYKLNMDQFEEYAVEKGYEFNKYDRNDDYNGVGYAKGVGKQTKYLTFYDSWFSYGKNINYQISNQNEVFSLKKQLKETGFKLNDTYFMEDKTTKVEKFRNAKFELSTYTMPPDEDRSYVFYEIGFRTF